MWNDRIDMLALVQECLMSKTPSKMGLIVDTLIAKGYHRCDKDEGKKMDAVDRALDMDSAQALRVNSMNEVVYDFMVKSTEFPEGSGERGLYQKYAMDVTEIIFAYNTLRAETQRKNGLV